MSKDLLLPRLREVEPDAEHFEFNLPLVTSSSGKSYYAKIGRPAETEQYKGEIESLRLISLAASGLAPRVLSEGVDEHGRPFCISDYNHLGSLTTTSSTKLATRLATELHSYRSEMGFGFEVPTFCGATRLKNGWYDSWETCYDALIGDLLQGLSKRATNKALCDKGEAVRRTCVDLSFVYHDWDSIHLVASVIPYLLRPLKVDPVLLHGDLWVKKATRL